MRLVGLFCLLGLLFWLGAEARAPVILICIDGLSDQILPRADEFGLKIPNLRKLMARGATAEYVRSVNPALTIPAHATMVTGVYPSQHGLYTNLLPAAASGSGKARQFHYTDYKTKTIFDAAHDAGFVQIGVDWPVSDGAPLYTEPPVRGAKKKKGGKQARHPLDAEEEEQGASFDSTGFVKPIMVPQGHFSSKDNKDEFSLIEQEADLNAVYHSIVANMAERSHDSFPLIDKSTLLREMTEGPSPHIYQSFRQLFSLTDRKRADMALELMRAYNPMLSAIHFDDFDEAQHLHGTQSPESFVKLELIDDYIGEILQLADELRWGSKASVVLASDHGFTNTSSLLIAPDCLLHKLDLLGPGDGLPYRVYPVVAGGMSAFYVHPDLPHSQLDKLERVLRELHNRGEFHINKLYTREDVVSAEMFPGAFAAMELTHDAVFSSYSDGLVNDPERKCATFHRGRGKGQHGYSADDPAMRAGLIIAGPRVKEGCRFPPVEIADLAPTIAKLLGVEFTARPGQHVEGKVIDAIFK